MLENGEPSFSSALIGALGSVVTAVIAWLAFWLRLERRVTKAEITAQNALQVAAEADEELKEMREAAERYNRSEADNLDRMRREFGETVRAALNKIHEFETWSRDNFVRQPFFDNAIQNMEKRLDDRLARIESMLDNMKK
jgi:phytoene dehydrogenase-like protein